MFVYVYANRLIENEVNSKEHFSKNTRGNPSVLEMNKFYILISLNKFYILISLTVLRFFLSIVLCRFPTKNFRALWSRRFNDSGSLSYACMMGTIANANRNKELWGTCRTIRDSFAQRYTAYKVCGMRNNESSLRLFFLSKRTPSPATKPATAGIHGDKGGCRNWKLRRRHIPYLASITMVARNAVDHTTFFTMAQMNRFGLLRNCLYLKKMIGAK